MNASGLPALPTFSRPPTPRQGAALELVARGFSDKEIAARLGITRSTVRRILQRIYETRGVRGRSAAAVAWLLSAERRHLHGEAA